MSSILKIIAAVIIALFIIMFCFSPVLAQEEVLPLHQKRFSDRVLIVWAGDAMQMIATVALATKKGLVVIETSLIREYDARIRKTIEKEFGRNDFKYLINTHYHHDHTAGNQIYSDATIIGHKNVPAGMKAELTGEGLVKLIDKFKGMLPEREKALKEADPKSRDYVFNKEFVILLKIAIRELSEGLVPTYPTILFEKNMILDMGDMTLELYAMGGMHTNSDIAIFVPEEGLLAVGDVPPERWLPYFRKEIAENLDTTLENWDRLINSGREIKYINMAHSDMYLTVETFKQQYEYLSSIWQGLSEMQRKDLTLEDAKQEFTLSDDFQYFLDERTQSRREAIHVNNIEVLWDLISKNK